jgi:hypothetical protein
MRLLLGKVIKDFGNRVNLEQHEREWLTGYFELLASEIPL